MFIAPVKSSLNESKNSKNIDFLDGSFTTASKVNGLDSEEDFTDVKKEKFSRMLSGQIDKDILKGFESKLSSSVRLVEKQVFHAFGQKFVKDHTKCKQSQGSLGRTHRFSTNQKRGN